MANKETSDHNTIRELAIALQMFIELAEFDQESKYGSKAINWSYAINRGVEALEL